MTDSNHLPIDSQLLDQCLFGDERCDYDALLKRIKSDSSRKIRPSRVLWARGSAVALAAAAIVLIAVGIKGKSPQALQTRTYTTQPGQRARITLTDGSDITLAPATKLKVNDRSVSLDGEAQFNVRSGGSAPFIVHVAGTETRVLGTSFIVRKYPNDAAVSVAVGDGKVAFQSAVLSAGQGARATAHSQPQPMTDTEVASSLGRTTGRLTFDRAEVREVVAELERWYGVQFKGLTSELLGYHITATFTGERLSEQTIQTLSIALNSRATQSGRVITFHHQDTEQDK